MADEQPKDRLRRELTEILAAAERTAVRGRPEWSAMVEHGQQCSVCDDEFCDQGAELATAWRSAVRSNGEPLSATGDGRLVQDRWVLHHEMVRRAAMMLVAEARAAETTDTVVQVAAALAREVVERQQTKILAWESRNPDAASAWRRELELRDQTA